MRKGTLEVFTNAQIRNITFTSDMPQTRMVKTVYFLVHPGFNGDPTDGKPAYNRVNKNELFKRYKQKAAELGEDGLMFVSTHLNKPLLVNSSLFRPPYDVCSESTDKKYLSSVRKLLRDIQAVLRNRLFILDNSINTFGIAPSLIHPTGDILKHEPITDSIEFIKKIAQIRGFEIPINIDVEVFGEDLGYCVLHTAGDLYRQNYFSGKIQIDVTSSHADSPQNTCVVALKEQYPDIVFI